MKNWWSFSTWEMDNPWSGIYQSTSQATTRKFEQIALGKSAESWSNLSVRRCFSNLDCSQLSWPLALCFALWGTRTDPIVPFRSPLFDLANTPRFLDQRRQFNAPMEAQDVPIVFGIVSFEHSWLRSKRLLRRFSRSLSKRSAKGWSRYDCFGCSSGRTCIGSRNSCTYLKTSFYEIMRLDRLAEIGPQCREWKCQLADIWYWRRGLMSSSVT